MDFLRDNWAGLVGVVGTVFSVLAFIQARAAARSAHDAAEQVREVKAKLIKKSLAEDLASLCHSADRAITMLTAHNAQVAYEVLGPALSGMRLLSARRRNELEDDQLRALGKGVDLLDKTLDLLSNQEMTADGCSACTRNIRKVQEVLIYCQGTVMAVVDQSE